MPRRLHQALIALAALAAVLAASAGAAAPLAGADTAAPRACRAQLAAECDGLLAAAVKTPYGWGWTGGGVALGDATTGRASRPARTRAAGPVTMDTRASAAAGLALHLAGGRLGEAKYHFAALHAARVLAAVQSHTGQVPASGIIRANAGGNDEPSLVPSRAATCASLALWLTLLHDAESSPGSDAAQVRSLRPAALKAASWLASQQTKLGGWPVEFVAVPSAPSARAARNPRAIRLIRLDRPDARDATFCLWLAASVLDDAKLRRRAEAAVEELSVLRIVEEKSPGRNLWSAAYNLDETPAKATEDLPYGVDLAAADYALQALLAASLLGDGNAAAPVLRQATAALARLPRHDGKWLRYYSISEGATPAQPVQTAEAGAAAPPESQVFDPGRDAKADSEPTAPPGLSLTVAAVARLAELGPAKYVEALAATVPVEHRLAMAICGLDEDALANEIPADPRGIEEYLERHKERFAVLDAPPSDDLAPRVQRLGLLLSRVQIDALGVSKPRE